MPISDPFTRRIADHYNLYKKICRKCGAHNPFGAEKCRRCHGYDLRQKRREKK